MQTWLYCVPKCRTALLADTPLYDRGWTPTWQTFRSIFDEPQSSLLGHSLAYSILGIGVEVQRRFRRGCMLHIDGTGSISDRGSEMADPLYPCGVGSKPVGNCISLRQKKNDTVWELDAKVGGVFVIPAGVAHKTFDIVRSLSFGLGGVLWRY